MGDGSILHRRTTNSAWVETDLSPFYADGLKALWGSSPDNVYLVARNSLLRFSCP